MSTRPGTGITTSMFRRCLVVVALIVMFVAGHPAPVSAHNSLLSSNPTDGATLAASPTQMDLVFDKPVPLDTMSAELVDPRGFRTDLTDIAHLPGGDTEIRIGLPATSAGGWTLRWRLVSADGHPITGRVAFTVAAANAPSTALLPATPPTTPRTAIVTTNTASTDQMALTGPSHPVRWFVRLVSYLAIVAIVGTLATAAAVWRPALDHPLLVRTQTIAAAVIAVLALLQLLMIAGDIDGVSTLSAWSGLGGATKTAAGRALFVRIVIAVIVGIVIALRVPSSPRSRVLVVGVLAVGLLVTWAWAGHARSLRWPVIGVPIDVVHHGAAAAWLGGIAILGYITMREATADETVGAVQQFSRMAPLCVIALVATGIVQTLRVVGNPVELFAATHGRLLVVKLVVLAAMLKVASINRRRVARGFSGATPARPQAVDMLRRALRTEFALGGAIIALTAGLVVSRPASAELTATPQQAPNQATPVNADPATANQSDAVAVTSGADTTSTSTSAATVSAPTTIAAATTTTIAVTCTVVGELTSGDSGSDVTCLQRALLREGLLTGDPTGTFDAATDTALRAFQDANGLLVDGIAGPVTLAALGIAA